MAYTTINKSTDYFSSDLWSGNSSTQAINVGKNFSSNGSLIWIKGRNGSGRSHRLLDSVRGKENLLASNSSDPQFTESGDGVASYSSTGFNLQFSSQNDYNESGGNYVGWNWLAGSSPTGSANTDGSINSTVSVNTTAGFSIVKYDSSRSPSAVQTVGHGLGVKPDMLIFKNLNETQNWLIWNKDIATNQHLNLNTTSALSTDAGSLNNTAPTSTVFTIGADGRTNSSTNGNPIICYAFAEKQGYSKFGSYTGNGNANAGTFVYTGFKPTFLIVKRTSSSGDDWNMWDSTRRTFNLTTLNLKPNASNAEGTADNHGFDLLSNGFAPRGSIDATNGNGSTYIYMAFGQSIVGTNNVPCTAR